MPRRAPPSSDRRSGVLLRLGRERASRLAVGAPSECAWRVRSGLSNRRPVVRLCQLGEKGAQIPRHMDESQNVRRTSGCVVDHEIGKAGNPPEAVRCWQQLGAQSSQQRPGGNPPGAVQCCPQQSFGRCLVVPGNPCQRRLQVAPGRRREQFRCHPGGSGVIHAGARRSGSSGASRPQADRAPGIRRDPLQPPQRGPRPAVPPAPHRPAAAG